MIKLIPKVLIIFGFIIFTISLYIMSEALLRQVIDYGRFFMGLLYGGIGIGIIILGGCLDDDGE